MKKLFVTLASAIVSVLIMGQVASAEGVTHYVTYHVDSADPKTQNLALNNINNMTQYYESIGDTVIIEVVANGPGVLMLSKEKSKVTDRIAVMSLEMENLTFAACAVSQHKISKKLGIELNIVAEASMTPSGVVRLLELQEQGYGYIRP